MSGDNRLVMLAKPPLPGRVKTRLVSAGGLTQADAAAFYAACLADLVSRLAEQPGYRLVVCGPASMTDAGRHLLRSLLPDMVTLVDEPAGSQQPRDLGQVMEDIAFAALAAGQARVALVGSDCALLTPARVGEAFAALDDHDLVLGPDGGGGCYLIGLRRELPLLTGPAEDGPIAWSQGTDFEELRRRAARLNLATAVLPEERDIDRPADILWLRETLAATDAAAIAPRVTAWLEAWWREGKRPGCRRC